MRLARARVDLGPYVVLCSLLYLTVLAHLLGLGSSNSFHRCIVAHVLWREVWATAWPEGPLEAISWASRASLRGALSAV